MFRSDEEIWINSGNSVFYIPPKSSGEDSHPWFLYATELSVFSPDRLVLQQVLPFGRDLLKIPNGSDIYLTRNRHGRADNFDTSEILQRFFSVKRADWSMQDLTVSSPPGEVCKMIVEFQFWEMD